MTIPISKIGEAVVILACGTANIGRVAQLAMVFIIHCDLAIIIFVAKATLFTLSNPLVRGYHDVDAGSRSGCDRQA